MSFAAIRASDLVLVAPSGEIVEGEGMITGVPYHDAVQRARPGIVGIAHAFHAKVWSAFGRVLDPITAHGQLTALAAGQPIIPAAPMKDTASRARAEVGAWLGLLPLWDRIVRGEPDLLDQRTSPGCGRKCYVPAMSWSRLYLFTALPLVLLLVLLMPLGEPPDEAAHIARAASLLRGELIGHRIDELHPIDHTPVRLGVVTINRGYLAPLFHLPSMQQAPNKLIERATLRRTYGAPWSGETGEVDASNTASYAPLFYGPAAIGLALGGIAGPPAAAVFVARLMNALACILAGAWALRLAGRTRPFLFALLLLPMSVQLDAAVNQDGLLIAAAVLAAAMLPRGGRFYWGGVAALAAVALAKPAYLPLTLAALVPLDGGAWRLRHAAGFALACVPALAWSALAAAVAVVPFWRPAYTPGPLWPGDPTLLLHATDMAAQLRVLLADPARLVTLPWSTLATHKIDFALSTIGILASLDLFMPRWLYAAWVIAGALAATAVLLPHRPARPHAAFSTALASLAVLCGAGVAVWAVLILQYLSWTTVGSPVIEGTQGRYFIPILAIAALAIPACATSGTANCRLRLALTLPVAAVACIGVVVVPAMVVLRYYVA